jgi:hypothetical protein
MVFPDGVGNLDPNQSTISSELGEIVIDPTPTLVRKVHLTFECPLVDELYQKMLQAAGRITYTTDEVQSAPYSFATTTYYNYDRRGFYQEVERIREEILEKARQQRVIGEWPSAESLARTLLDPDRDGGDCYVSRKAFGDFFWTTKQLLGDERGELFDSKKTTNGWYVPYYQYQLRELVTLVRYELEVQLASIEANVLEISRLEELLESEPFAFSSQDLSKIQEGLAAVKTCSDRYTKLQQLRASNLSIAPEVEQLKSFLVETLPQNRLIPLLEEDNGPTLLATVGWTIVSGVPTKRYEQSRKVSDEFIQAGNRLATGGRQLLLDDIGQLFSANVDKRGHFSDLKIILSSSAGDTYENSVPGSKFVHGLNKVLS